MFANITSWFTSGTTETLLGFLRGKLTVAWQYRRSYHPYFVWRRQEDAVVHHFLKHDVLKTKK